MKKANIILTILGLSFGFFHSAFATNDPDMTECSAYRDRSEELNCSEKDYFINFGERYCQMFIEKNAHFTAYGQSVLVDLRSCLIESMQNDSEMTCENAKDLAEEHHYNCYMDSGYCSLGLYDRLQLAWIVRHEFFDPGFLIISERVNQGCFL